MKKNVVLIALLILLSVLAANRVKAETVPQAEDLLGMPFPKSIPWDSSEEEILLGLDRPEEKPVFGDHPDAAVRIYQFPVLFADYPSEFAMVFLNHQPIEFDVFFSGEGKGNPTLGQVLLDLTEQYGVPNSEDYDLVIRIAEATGSAVDDSFMTVEKYLWELPDGRTVILLAEYQGIGISALDRSVLS